MPQKRWPQIPRRRQLTAGVGMFAVLALTVTGCEADPEQAEGGGAADGPASPGSDETEEAPDPQGDQLSHDEMREALDEHVSEARLTDTDNYMPGLDDVETELSRLTVEPQDCTQYVVQSATPVPEGALVVFADNSTVEEGSAGEDDPDAGSDDDGDDDGDGDLPDTRQVTAYSFQDNLAADAHFSNERDGLEACSSYTAARSGPEGDDVQTESTISEAEVSSEAEEAIGMTRELSYDESTEHSVIVLLRQDSQVLALGVPLEGELDEDEAEAAVEDLETEAAQILSDLTGDDL